MQPMVVYRRTIRASTERIWENVLDWEHLPWLHASSFLAVELLERRRDGFRAWLTSQPAEKARRSLVEVQLHRDELHYWTRTVEGSGAGSEIRTTLSPAGEHATDIVVEFFVPAVPPEHAEKVGAAYTGLYERLWDEDEAMMQRRQVFVDDGEVDTPVSGCVALGPADALRRSLPRTIEIAGRPIRLIEMDGEIAAYSARCPHLGGPLEEASLDGGILTCPWHGYRFDVRSGASADGRRLRLACAPRVEIDAAGNARLVGGVEAPASAG